jgi:hypothetical protein
VKATSPQFAGSLGQGLARGRGLRPSAKLLPQHGRGHNRSLLLQTLDRAGQQSRAAIADRFGVTVFVTNDASAAVLAEHPDALAARDRRGDDIVLRGAAASVLSSALGVS